MHFGAVRKLFEYAQLLRDNPTPAEKILWEKLRQNQLGEKFRRQHPIKEFIVDFYCHKLKLIIEVDGSIHNIPEVADLDTGREYELNELGLKIIRFSNEDIFNNLTDVIQKVKYELSPPTP